MVALWPVPGVGSITDTGLVELSDGRTFDLSTVPGNGYNANRLAKINAAIRDAVDVRVLLASLPADEPFKGSDPALPHVFWGDVDGNKASEGAAATHLITRQAEIWLTWNGSILIPNCSVPG